LPLSWLSSFRGLPADTELTAAGQDSDMTDAIRTLILLRHGKSAYPGGVEDHDRPLANRGRRQAALAGAWIADHQPPLDRILCSTAERTRQTLSESGLIGPVTYLKAIYGAEPDELLDVLRDLDQAEHTVLLVGHAPGLPDLAEELAGSGSDPAALDRLRAGFPTSALAVLAVTGDWSAIGPGRAALLDYVIAR
jgi:phosphohistidine phosphatase